MLSSRALHSVGRSVPQLSDVTTISVSSTIRGGNDRETGIPDAVNSPTWSEMAAMEEPLDDDLSDRADTTEDFDDCHFTEEQLAYIDASKEYRLDGLMLLGKTWNIVQTGNLQQTDMYMMNRQFIVNRQFMMNRQFMVNRQIMINRLN